ncbi:MAG: CDP-alcohol phosphatidyltransferase family protein [Saprospiraceae bacterium]|nr:hypothetical protein [Lewinella sp.]
MAKFLAWCVHAFTASGLLSAFMAILAIDEGNFRTAMLWLFLCQIIDGVDGTFARIFRVKEVLPGVSGSTIDYVIDFATYAIIPAYFFYRAELVPEPWSLYLTFLILLVSALYYGVDKMVSDEMHFIGFPVMWNMVVLFLYFIFDLSALGNALLIVFFAILHFIPIKFAYPSRARRFKWLILGNTVLFLLAVLGAVWWYPKAPGLMTWTAIVTVSIYGILAVIETLGTEDGGKRSMDNMH